MKSGMVTGEATPYYIFHPTAPNCIAKVLPNVKLITLIRNPVDRAYSHYNHMVRVGREPLPFEEAIEHEAERLAGEEEKIIADPRYSTFNHLHYSYLARVADILSNFKNGLRFFRANKCLFLPAKRFILRLPSLIARQ